MYIRIMLQNYMYLLNKIFTYLLTYLQYNLDLEIVLHCMKRFPEWWVEII